MKRSLQVILPPIVLFAIVIAAWHFAVIGWEIKPYLVPKPMRVWETTIANWRELLGAFGLTAAAASCGFLASLLIGTVIACVFSQSSLIRRSCYPYAIFWQTVPIVAIAPLIVVWFGTGFHSVVLVAFLISLFPIITNGTNGMIAIDSDLLDLFGLYRATRWQVLWKLRLPHSVPFLVTGARTSSGLSVVGAIVGEFFAGNLTGRYGLGYVIYQAQSQVKTDRLFAGMIFSAVLGLAIFGLSTVIGSTVLNRWSDPTGSETSRR